MSSPAPIPTGYPELLEELKGRIRGARLRAAFAVSRELVLLYWAIGREILERQKAEGWGARVIDRLAHDLQVEFPGVEGYSSRSLKYMRALAEAWPDAAVVQQVVARLPWGHHTVLLDRLKTAAEREWYLHAALEHGWSRNVLGLQIQSGLHLREGKALTNFARALPPEHSDLARQILKDPYNFDFLTVSMRAQERDIERGLLTHLRDLLLELGRGFSFVGSQVPLEVGGETFYLDLLFYHIRLHRYVVIELKTGRFQPEWTGKLAFYLAAVNKTMRTEVEQPSIGILLCESRTDPVVEFALENIAQPIGVSTYRLTRELPGTVQAEMPSVEDLRGIVLRLRDGVAAAEESDS